MWWNTIKRHRNPNELLTFGETTLRKTFPRGKNGFWTNVWSNWHEVKRKYRLQKGTNQANPSSTGIHPEYWTFCNNAKFTNVNLDYNYSMANTMQVIIKDNKFCFSVYIKEDQQKIYQIYPIAVFPTRPEFRALARIRAICQKWPEIGPKLAWKMPLGPIFSRTLNNTTVIEIIFSKILPEHSLISWVLHLKWFFHILTSLPFK